MDIKTRLASIASEVEKAIPDFCDKYLVGPDKLTEAMRYSLTAGGKRIRPALVLLSAEMCGGDLNDAMIPAIAIEMIHTFSLIHDDLPAMDDDDLRRGKATCHKVYGEAMAILAGDALLAFAFELIGDHYDGPADRKIKMIADLARATGPGGMTGGQVLDMDCGGEVAWTQAMVEETHKLKTAALLQCACRLGAVSAGADEKVYEKLSEYGLKIGLTFQIIDDYLDQTSSAGVMGKCVGKDAEGQKPNYVILTGSAEKAYAQASALVSEAKECLEALGDKAKPLQELAEMLLKRKS